MSEFYVMLYLTTPEKDFTMAMNKRQMNNQAMMQKIKTDRGCESCGYKANPAALQFDHLDPATKLISASGRRVTPASMLGYSQAMILAEIAKCRVLCANCHAIHTVEQGNELRAKGLMRKGGRPKLSVVSDRLVA
jgi:hypothetical protein